MTLDRDSVASNNSTQGFSKKAMLFDWSWSPQRWREEAAKYAQKRAMTDKPSRRERYAELTELCLEKARRLEFYGNSGHHRLDANPVSLAPR